jgi:hypothetical protein
MTMPGGTVIQPTNKSFHVDFCTVARWNEQGQIDSILLAKGALLHRTQVSQFYAVEASSVGV